MKYGEIILHTATISLMEYRKRYQHIEQFIECCKRCHNYAQQWVCPPYECDIQEELKPYHHVDIFGHQIVLSPSLKVRKYNNPEEQTKIISQIMSWARHETDPMMLRLEGEHPRSRACYAGSCKLCPEGACTRIATPQSPCRHPEEARHSLENYGFDLGKTASELLGIPMLWGRDGYLPDYYLLISGLLY